MVPDPVTAVVPLPNIIFAWPLEAVPAINTLGKNVPAEIDMLDVCVVL